MYITFTIDGKFVLQKCTQYLLTVYIFVSYKFYIFKIFYFKIIS